MKRFLIVFLLMIAVFSGCAEEARPMCVTIKNQTLPYSPKSTITVVFAEDKRIRDKFCDIEVRSKGPDVSLFVGKELGEPCKIFLEEAGKWYSLSALMGPNFKPSTFAKAQTTTYVLWAENEAKIAFKAVGGDLAASGAEQKPLQNVFDVSKEVWINLPKTPQNA